MMRVRVPATSANLGPGFDCLGLALGLDLVVTASPSTNDRFRYRGEGALPDVPDNLIHQGFRAVFAHVGKAHPSIAFDVENPIPLARGLGSSSAALVAGAALADVMLGEPLGRDGVFQLAAKLEGHPDNVAAAVYGGFTVSAATAEGGYLTDTLPLPARWNLLFGVPDFELPTAAARAVLPDSYPRRDAVTTASRTALWAMAVITDRPELLRAAASDVLHEPYREPLVPRLTQTRSELQAAGAHAAFLSGAGPTLGVVTDRDHRHACAAILERFVGNGGRVLEPGVGSGYSLLAVTAAPEAP